MTKEEAIEIVRKNWPEGRVMLKSALEVLIPELKESEDERMKGKLREILRLCYTECNCSISTFDYETLLTWLETQGVQETACDKCRKAQPSQSCQDITELGRCYAEHEQKYADTFEPKFKVGDFVVSDYCIGKVIELNNDAYLLDSGQGIPFSCEHKAHIWTIQDAKEGDVLAFDDDNIVIFKDLYNSSTFHSYCHIEDGTFDFNDEYLFDWWNGEGFKPATQKQRDLLYQKMKDAGYEWDSGKRELRKIEHEQKPADKTKPKFNVGDWVARKYPKSGSFVYRVDGVKRLDDANYGYHLDDGTYFSGYFEKEYHLWTIQDAKEGDVLAEDSCIFIIQKLGDNGSAAKTYCSLYSDGDFDDGTILYFDADSTKPATKEQRDLLFQKMKDAGYKWDSEKMELRKIEQKPADTAEPESFFYCKYGGTIPLCSDCKRNCINSPFKTEDITTWYIPSKTTKQCLNYIACFEKQSEQTSPAKFNVGDWITFYKDKPYKISKIDAEINGVFDYHLVDQNGYDAHYKNARLWTIQDAKDGDVLSCENGWTCIFKALDNHTNTFSSYCFLDKEGWLCEDGGQAHTIDNRICGEIHPSTKEQRDFLIKAMTDAGYTFDFENKELKKIL